MSNAIFQRTFDVCVDPEEAAEAFASWGDEAQVRFFNALAVEVAKWKAPFCFQMQYIVDCSDERLTREALNIMDCIGDYAKDEL